MQKNQFLIHINLFYLITKETVLEFFIMGGEFIMNLLN